MPSAAGTRNSLSLSRLRWSPIKRITTSSSSSESSGRYSEIRTPRVSILIIVPSPAIDTPWRLAASRSVTSDHSVPGSGRLSVMSTNPPRLFMRVISSLVAAPNSFSDWPTISILIGFAEPGPCCCFKMLISAPASCARRDRISAITRFAFSRCCQSSNTVRIVPTASRGSCRPDPPPRNDWA